MIERCFERIPAILLIASCVLLIGCEAPPVPPLTEPVGITVDADKAFATLEAICDIGPRYSGSNGAQQTVDLISARCKEMGYTPVVDEWTESTPTGDIVFRNVIAELKGRRPGFMILGTHYDTKVLETNPPFIGANDSGSSTALTLEIMRVLKAGDWPGPSIRFAFFDGEECQKNYRHDDGLHGSKRLANQLRKNGEAKACRAMVLLDMIGDADLNVTIPQDNRKLGKLLFAIADRQGTRKHFSFYLGGSILDDHVPFQELGIPAIDIIDFDYGPNNSYWHTGEDTVDKISPKSLEIIGNATIQLLAEIPVRKK
jgi:glutaminyl-peptide cyclotransferase